MTYITEAERKSALTHAVQVAFQRARTTPTDWRRQVRKGRLDGRRVTAHATTQATDIFRTKTIPGATKVNVHFLVDGSGSMNNERIRNAADVCDTMVAAFASSPLVRLHVWMHNTGGSADLQVVSVVRDGKGRENIKRMPHFVQGGNGDGYVLQWLGEYIRKHRRPDEVNLVILISDGLPSWVPAERHFDPARHEVDEQGLRQNERAARDAANNMRFDGTYMLAVSIVPNPKQDAMYGAKNVIPFDGDWNQMAADFGTALGGVLIDATRKAGKGVRR